MPSVRYVQPDQTVVTVEVAAGTSVMMGGVTNGVDGIVAECGGSLMCATCHVYFADEALVGLVPMSESEDELLDCTAEPRRSTSRLSCQVPVTAALDGATVVVPSRQT
ncbi:2Fe-2S iron-sulfur cluster-binding protein [Desertimonas flava]|uniref:2Fe-2S iron-sulfur cluster-binding protein n=1 Tax=Desertimonas flava TaxID=2064846 RepID=UPI000E34AA88|nr:2Fe-2S iron-sulfur cluster-binding protein [Desertimonas flava]